MPLIIIPASEVRDGEPRWWFETIAAAEVWLARPAAERGAIEPEYATGPVSAGSVSAPPGWHAAIVDRPTPPPPGLAGSIAGMEAAVKSHADLRRRQAELREWLRENDMDGLECSQAVMLERVNGDLLAQGYAAIEHAPALLARAKEAEGLRADLVAARDKNTALVALVEELRRDLAATNDGEDAANAELTRLRAAINTPQIADFLEGVRTEAVHQRERWGAEHDAGKRVEDWIALFMYLLGKATKAHYNGDRDKLLHHVVTVGAVALNMHANLTGVDVRMRPGVDESRAALTATTPKEG